MMTRARATNLPADQALRSNRWEESRDAFLAGLVERPDGVAFEGLAQALWWLDDGTACLAARERAYRFYRDAADDAAAAGAACALAYDSLLFGEGEAVARGWLGRAHDLLDKLSERTEHGWLAVREAELVLATGAAPGIASQAGDRACAIGQRLGDADLIYVGMALSGLAQTTAGDPGSGMFRLDAAVAAATTGEVADVMWMGKIFCWLIIACQQTHDLTRADEWCRRVEIICQRQDLDPLITVCRIQYSSILMARGTWRQAERNLTSALDETVASRRHTRQDAVVLLGELRRRQGRLTEAEELLRQAEFDPSAIVSRALIRLARGESRQAWEDVRAVLSTIPHASRLVRARFLLPAVRTAHAAGAHSAAAEAAAELNGIAGLIDNGVLSGLAAAASATLAQPADAVGLWREAVHCFHEAHLPFDEAESRVNLAAALLDVGDVASAAEQATNAIRVLGMIGAGAALTNAQMLGRDIATAHGHPRHGDLTAREAHVLHLVAEGLTNHQIATALSLSPHTVHRHIANILAKMHQPTRAAAAAYAITNGLL